MKSLSTCMVRTLLGVTLALAAACRTFEPEPHQTRSFASPAAAGDALVAALRSDDGPALAAILGPGSRALLSSGDPVDDRAQQEQFVTAYAHEHSWVASTSGDETQILEIGENAWPFPVPAVKHEDGWRFDTKQGIEELRNRRVGRNELSAIQSCLAFVDAEREYLARNPRELATPEFARFIISSDQERDGLYWKTSAAEDPSPLGPIYAAARSEGYALRRGEAEPFHGYFYRILRAQGQSAPGGAYSYMNSDQLMTRGFALIAWPAKYGASGVMTFMVNQIGAVYEKNLGPKTAEVAASIATFDPDQSWELVSDEARTLN